MRRGGSAARGPSLKRAKRDFRSGIPNRALGFLSADAVQWIVYGAERVQRADSIARPMRHARAGGRAGACVLRSGAVMLRAATASVLLAMMAAGTAAESPAATPAERRLDLGSLSLEQLLEIEVPIVYGASRYDQKATLAPSSVTLITADEIRRHGYRTVAEALNSLPGVFLSNDRNYHYLGIRGFLRPGDTLTRLLFLVDGHRMNDNVFGGTHVGTDSIVDLD